MVRDDSGPIRAKVEPETLSQGKCLNWMKDTDPVTLSCLSLRSHCRAAKFRNQEKVTSFWRIVAKFLSRPEGKSEA